MQLSDMQIAVVGLGYVGLPLAVEFGRKRSVVGFDINESRIKELENYQDNTLATNQKELKDAIYLSYSSNLEDIKDCKIYIITVPTPIDNQKKVMVPNDPQIEFQKERLANGIPISKEIYNLIFK